MFTATQAIFLGSVLFFCVMYTMNKFRTIGRLKRAREAGGDPVPWFAWDNAVLGTLPYYLWFYRKDEIGFMSFCSDGYERHGDTFGLTYAGRDMVVSRNLDNVAHLLSREHFRKYKRNESHTYKALFGDGIFMTNGDEWAFHRRMARPLFTKDSLAAMMPTFVANSQRLSNRIAKLGAGEEIDMYDMFMRFTMDSFGSMGLGHDFNTLEGDEPFPFAKAFDSAQYRLDRGRRKPWYKAKNDKVLQDNLKVLDEITYGMIKETRALGEEVLQSRTDLLARFMMLTDDEGHRLSNKYLRDVVLNFLIAGRDTTAQLLTWTFFLLSENPHIVAKAREEIDRVLGGRDPEPADIPNLKYLKCMLSEALRFYPSVPVEGRMATETFVLPSGHVIEKNQTLVYSAWEMGRNATFWGADAAEYKPERFMDGSAYENPAFRPFHGGPMLCLGQDLAYMEATTALAVILKDHRLVVSPGFKVVPCKAITLPAKGGLRMVRADD